eukprot:6045777-Karenia_brevis.AAC.1
MHFLDNLLSGKTSNADVDALITIDNVKATFQDIRIPTDQQSLNLEDEQLEKGRTSDRNQKESILQFVLHLRGD